MKGALKIKYCQQVMKSSTAWCNYFSDAALALHKIPSTFHIPVEETYFQLQGKRVKAENMPCDLTRE